MTTDNRPQTGTSTDLLELSEEERGDIFVQIRDEVLAASTDAAAAVRPGDQPFADRLFLHAMDRVGPSTSDEIELLGMPGFVAKIAQELTESERKKGGPVYPSYFPN